jgi:hypothetical protein
MDNGDFIYADVAKENIGAVMSQYTHLVWEEKRKDNPNLKEIERLYLKRDESATILFSFHEILRDDYKSIAEKYGQLFKDNEKKIEDNIPL